MRTTRARWPHPVQWVNDIDSRVRKLLAYAEGHVKEDSPSLSLAQWCPEAYTGQYMGLIGEQFLVFRLPRGALEVLRPFMTLPLDNRFDKKWKETRLNTKITKLRAILGYAIADMFLRVVEKGIGWFVDNYYKDRTIKFNRLRCLDKQSSMAFLSRDDRGEVDAGPSLNLADRVLKQPIHWDGLANIWSMVLMCSEGPATIFGNSFTRNIAALIAQATTDIALGEAYLQLLQDIWAQQHTVTDDATVNEGTGFIFDTSVTLHAGAAATNEKPRMTLYAEMLPTNSKPKDTPTADVVLSSFTLALPEFQKHMPFTNDTWPTGASVTDNMESFLTVVLHPYTSYIPHSHIPHAIVVSFFHFASCFQSGHTGAPQNYSLRPTSYAHSGFNRPVTHHRLPRSQRTPDGGVLDGTPGFGLGTKSCTYQFSHIYKESISYAPFNNVVRFFPSSLAQFSLLTSSIYLSLSLRSFDPSHWIAPPPITFFSPGMSRNIHIRPCKFLMVLTTINHMR